MARNNGEPTRVEKALSEFVDQLVARMEDASRDLTWNKGWTGRRNFYVGLPQNIKGNTYVGGNAFLLQLRCNRFDYSVPVFMTFNQAKELGVRINRGERSHDVFKWGLRVYDKETGKRIPESEYDALTKEEKEAYRVVPYLKTFVEFNIDQTNFKEVYPERYKALLEKFQVGVDDRRRDSGGMYVNESLDRVIHENGAWICPIHEKEGSDAYYVPRDNEIYIPAKADFNVHRGDAEETYKDGQEFYSTALHEMAHSTGHESQLDRPGITSDKARFGSPLYAKEELVAELTAAMVCNAMGFDKRITENRAAYLKDWAEKLKQDPKYIVSVMSDVNKSSRIELERIDAQRKALGLKGLLEGNLDGVEEKRANDEELAEVKSAQEKVRAFDAEYLDVATPSPADQLQAALVEIREEHPEHPLAKVRNVGEFREYFEGKDTSVASWVRDASVRELVEEGHLDTLNNVRFRHNEGRTLLSISQADFRVNTDDHYKVYYQSLGDEGIRRFENHQRNFNAALRRYEDNITMLSKYGKNALKYPDSHIWVERNEYIRQENMEKVETGRDKVYYSPLSQTSSISDVVDDDVARGLHNTGKDQLLYEMYLGYQQQSKASWDQQHLSSNHPKDGGKTVLGEDDKYVLAYDETLTEPFELYEKVSDRQVRDMVKQQGIDSDSSAVARSVATDMVAEEFEDIRSNTLEMPNGDVLYVGYDKENDKIVIGPSTNAGIIHRHEFDYDHSISLDANIQNDVEQVQGLPEYQQLENEEQEEEAKEVQTATEQQEDKSGEERSGAETMGKEPTEEEMQAQYKQIARQFAEMPVPAFTMDNGKQVDFAYDPSDNNVYVGKTGTEGSPSWKYKFEFDTSKSVADNMSAIFGVVSKQREYQQQGDTVFTEQTTWPPIGYTEHLSKDGESQKEASTVHEDVNARKTAEDTAKVVEAPTVDPRDEKNYFVSYAFMQFEDDTRPFDELASVGDEKGLLNLAGEYDQDQEMDLHYVMDHKRKYQGDEVLCENDDIAVVYNGATGGTYSLLSKVSENDIREAIEESGGLDYGSRPEYPKSVWQIQRDMVEEEWSRDVDSPVVETDSGKSFRLSYDRDSDSIIVRDPEHLDEGAVNVIKYDYGHSVMENFGYVQEEMSNLYPQRDTQRTLLPDTEKMAILKNIVKFAESDTHHPLHDVSNMNSFKEAFAKSTNEGLYSNYVDDRSFMDYDGESLGEVKDFVASASQETLLKAGVDGLPNYHYPHHEGRTYSSMVKAIMRIEDIANANAGDEHLKKRLGQAYDIYATYRKRTFEGLSEAEGFKVASPTYKETIPRSHYADGIRPMDIRERFREEHSENFDLRLPDGEVRHMRYNVEKDAYDIGRFVDGDRGSFVVEDSYPVKDYDMDETVELYRHLTGIKAQKLEPVLVDEWEAKVPDEGIVYSDGQEGTVRYDLADDTIEVMSEVSDYEDYDARLPYDHRVSVEENLKRVADVLAYNGYEIKSYPIDLSQAGKELGEGKDVGQVTGQSSPTMEDYIGSLKDSGEPLSGDYSKLPKGSDAYKAWQENEDLAKEYDRFVKDPSSFDYQERAELFADLGAAGLKLSTAIKKGVDDYRKSQQTAHEDSNIETNVAGEARRIAATGVPMAKAEKIAKEDADDLTHAQKHEEDRQAMVRDKREKELREQREKEQKAKEEARPTMAVTHAAILLTALAAAKDDGGVWLNKGRRESASFLFSNKAISPYNELMMNLHAGQNGYRSNIYTYYNAAKDNGLPVMKGQAGLPFSWTKWEYVNNADKEKVIGFKEYHALPEEDRKAYTVRANRQMQHIYNIDQTVMPSKAHDDYVNLVKVAGDQVETIGMDKETAIYSKYSEMTKKHPDAITVMAEGDSYRAYGSSARQISKVLGIPVGKAEYVGKEVSFIEFPKTSLDNYLPRFIASGKRTAIVDPLVDPRFVKSMVDTVDVSNKVQSYAQAVAKADGMRYERVMEDVRTKYSEASDTLTVSGMGISGLSKEDSAIRKANDVYRALAAAVGTRDRLDRGGRNHLTPFDDAKYDKLVQELVSGVLVSRQGLPARLSDEGMKLIPYWEREIKENPRMMGIIERDVSNTVEVLDTLSKGEKPNYSKILGNVPGKSLLLREDYTFVEKLNEYPDMGTKELVIVKDTKSSRADVILPAGASLAVDNEVSGMRKDRITIALRNEGIGEVKFYNAGGALGLRQPNDYFKDKEVGVVRLKQYQLVTHDVVDSQAEVKREKVVVEDFKVLKNDDGKWFFHVKPVGEKAFDIVPPKTLLNSYFSARKTKSAEKISGMTTALAAKLAELASEHPDVRENLIMPKVSEDVDMSRITRANITQSSQDSRQKIVTAVIDGERHTANISDAQFRKMFQSENIAEYKKAVAAVVFEPLLKVGAKEGQDTTQEVRNDEKQDEGRGADIVPGAGGNGNEENETNDEDNRQVVSHGRGR